jgi:hypothetical protein
MLNGYLRKRPLVIFWVLGALLLLLYSAIYLVYPFRDAWNDAVLYVVYIITVSTPALVVTVTLQLYDVNDLPRRVWLNFTIGFWGWVVAEFIWVAYILLAGNPPRVNLSDLFYLFGYVFITMGVYHQYLLLGQPAARWSRWAAILFWGLAILLTLLALVFTGAFFDPAMFLEDLFGITDLMLGAVALIMLSAFRGGALARPWRGFIVLALANVFYAWLSQTGAYQVDTVSGDVLRLISDLVYMLSYLVLASGFLYQYLLLRFGPRISGGEETHRKENGIAA